jgi:Penicillinase repressor
MKTSELNSAEGAPDRGGSLSAWKGSRSGGPGGIAGPDSYSGVRRMLTLLEEKGHVRHKRDGMRYVYAPAIAPAKARRSALRSVSDRGRVLAWVPLEHV